MKNAMPEKNTRHDRRVRPIAVAVVDRNCHNGTHPIPAAEKGMWGEQKPEKVSLSVD